MLGNLMYYKLRQILLRSGKFLLQRGIGIKTSLVLPSGTPFIIKWGSIKTW